LNFTSSNSENSELLSQSEYNHLLNNLPGNNINYVLNQNAHNLKAGMDQNASDNFLKRWNRTLNNWNNGILTIEDLPPEATLEDKDFVDFLSFMSTFEDLQTAHNETLEEGEYDSIADAFSLSVETFQVI
jgi:hypothetical protein